MSITIIVQLGTGMQVRARRSYLSIFYSFRKLKADIFVNQDSLTVALYCMD